MHFDAFWKCACVVVFAQMWISRYGGRFDGFRRSKFGITFGQEMTADYWQTLEPLHVGLLYHKVDSRQHKKVVPASFVQYLLVQ
jgi:hypothetical protein